jgi:hypothetical protein
MARLSKSLADLKQELNHDVVFQTAFVSAQILNNTQALGKSTLSLVPAIFLGAHIQVYS